ncbi:hypothetical protein Q5692_38945 [Microcoleus sp. C2C3]|uniref:hypothetical protein n=1 Tax=unclassified Microcoleus TaxID=2642155 RepID=UPI002FD39698
MKFKHSRRYDYSQSKWSRHYRKARSNMLQLAMVSPKHTPDNLLYVGDRPKTNKLPKEAAASTFTTMPGT